MDLWALTAVIVVTGRAATSKAAAAPLPRQSFGVPAQPYSFSPIIEKYQLLGSAKELFARSCQATAWLMTRAFPNGSSQPCNHKTLTSCHSKAQNQSSQSSESSAHATVSSLSQIPTTQMMILLTALLCVRTAPHSKAVPDDCWRALRCCQQWVKGAISYTPPSKPSLPTRMCRGSTRKKNTKWAQWQKVGTQFLK